jgi:hypothetical protein
MLPLRCAGFYNSAITIIYSAVQYTDKLPHRCYKTPATQVTHREAKAKYPNLEQGETWAGPPLLAVSGKQKNNGPVSQCTSGGVGLVV